VKQPFKVIETKGLTGRVTLVCVALAAIVFGWFSVRWQIGNMFGALTQANAPNAEAIAEAAYGFSPNDPMTNWLRASVYREQFTPEATAKAVAAFEEMVRKGPYDFRAWIELARALEQVEQYERADRSFRRAIELAPNYSYSHWHFANFLLRQGRSEEALNEFRTAAESSSEYREQVFSIVWENFDKDTAKLEELVGLNPEVRAGLAKFYAAKELAPESLRVWNTLTPEQKQDHQPIAKIIAQALYEKRYYRSAVAFVHQTALESQAKAETIQNGGFETPIPEDASSVYFGWKVIKLDKVDIRSDQIKKREGGRSLKVSLSGFSAIEIKNLWQVVAVEPGIRYRLVFWLRTEDLKSAGTPLIEVVNAADNKIVTTSGAFPTGTNEWSEVKMDFTAPADAEGLLVRLDRSYCGDACPIVGSFWIDDFRLERLK